MKDIATKKANINQKLPDAELKNSELIRLNHK